MKIRVSKLIDKVSKDGKPYLLQPIRVNQFPHDDVTVWSRPFEAGQAHPEGVFEADAYIVEYKVTDKATGQKVLKQEFRFANLRPVAE